MGFAVHMLASLTIIGAFGTSWASLSLVIKGIMLVNDQ